MTGIIGKKIGMVQVFVDGKAMPATAIEAGPCKIVALKDKDRSAVALSFGNKSKNKTSKAMKTIFNKAGVESAAIVKEFKVNDVKDYQIGQDICADVFENIKFVDITGTSKGKGFQGVMKRHGFKGGPASHGSTKFHRRPGSIGSIVAHGRVFPGKKMPGQYGNAQVTTQNLEVLKVDKENNMILVKGAVPGSRNGFVVIKPAIKRGLR